MRIAKLLPVTVLAMALWALPASAGAEEIVPPGNSAASQYTEAFPTAGGEKETEDGAKKKKAVPADALGARNAHRLESKGDEGKAVAEFAAETAPVPASSSPPSAADDSSVGNGSQSDSAGRGNGDGGNGSAGGGDESAGGGASTGGGSGGAGAAAVNQPSGSSGLGEVLGQATGSSSSGSLGLLLPLIVIGAIVWSLFFIWRQKQRVA